MTTEAVPAPGRDTPSRSLEQALRWLATRRHAAPLALLTHALEDPRGEAATTLDPLMAPTATLPISANEDRVLATWGLIIECVDHIGPNNDSRRRNALHAAFRLPRRAEVAEPWKSSLEARFDQLKALPGVFGDPAPTTTAPMHKAWSNAVRLRLVPMLREQLPRLVDHETRSRLVKLARSTEVALDEERALTKPPAAMADYRPPSEGAQPVFMDLFITTVFMKRRTVYRRITERLLTARKNGVDHYIARALGGEYPEQSNTPVQGLFGCRAERLVASSPGEPLLTRLWFGRPLRQGEKHYFSSEVIDDDLTEERLWVNVEVDHYGIAPGERHNGHVPVSGLTIRIRFDSDHLPEACWAYAEQTERERHVKPPKGDPRWLTLKGNTVEYTFPGQCQPRENYGVSILWPKS